jgi:MYXO-CTERM domain-containing protein
MPSAQAAWITGLLALPLVVLLAFMRRRRRTIDYAESKAVKVALPWWVKSAETLLMLAFGYLWATAGFKLYVRVRGSRSGVDAPPAGAAAVYVVLGLGFIIIPLAMLSANAASGIIPFLRNANEQAFRGTRVSFRSANAGLIRFASVSVLFGIATLLVAAIEPWSR